MSASSGSDCPQVSGSRCSGEGQQRLPLSLPHNRAPTGFRSRATSGSQVSSDSSSSDPCLETVKEQWRRRRRRTRRRQRKRRRVRSGAKRTRRALDRKKRVPISELFPAAGPSESLLSDDTTPRCLFVTHRPLVMVEETGNDGVSALDGATNDLAQLIMTWNLEATPGAIPNSTQAPLKPSFVDSCGATPKSSKSPLQRRLLRE